MSAITLIVGLGNPGPEYRHTRHNAGEDWVRELARSHGVELVPTPKFYGDTALATINGAQLRLLIPATFMNLSGKAVGALAQFYKVPPEQILVAHDELDLPPGVARLKRGGGHGGHNGLKSIIAALGGNRDFARLRLGIGHPGAAPLVSGYVLRKAPTDEAQATADAAQLATKVVPELLAEQWDSAVRTLHNAC